MICSLSIHLFSISNDCFGPHFDVYCMVFMMRNVVEMFGEIEIKVAEVCNFYDCLYFYKGVKSGKQGPGENDFTTTWRHMTSK